MLKQAQIDKFYIDLGQLGLKFPVADIARATGFSKGNVSEYLNKKKEPSEAFLNAFYDKFFSGSNNVPHETIPPDSSKDQKIIRLLERENERLNRDLQLSLGSLRHTALLALAVAETNQQLLIELVMKLRKQDFEVVALEVGKENGERYKRLKEERNVVYGGN